jgi:hypothetical protein
MSNWLIPWALLIEQLLVAESFHIPTTRDFSSVVSFRSSIRKPLFPRRINGIADLISSGANFETLPWRPG